MRIDRRGMLVGMGGATGLAITGRELFGTSAHAAGAPRRDLYHCEGCEAAFERPLASMSSVVRLAGPNEPGERMLLTGRVLTPDGTRPVPDVIVYAHHTNAPGLYAGGRAGTEWSMRHGRLRGWAKSDAEGRYAFDTIKPAPYPNRSMPAHVHLYIGEPGRRPYYIDDVVFDGEFGVTPQYRAAQEFRAGSGIVRLGRTGDGRLLARRDVRLERHPA